MKMSKRYLAWYMASRCIHKDDGFQCEQAREIIVDKDKPPEERIVGKRADGTPKIARFHPSYLGDYCYYHRKKKEGKFGEVTKQKRSGHKVLKGSYLS